MFFDYHTHTYYSDDSDYPMEVLVQDAILKGIDEICFTDHVDYGIKGDWEDLSDFYDSKQKIGRPVMNVKYGAYHAEISRLQREYAGKIVLRTGMEFGMQTHTIPQFQKLFSSYPLDFVILSCHQVEDKEFYKGDFQKNLSQKEYNERYYREILNNIMRYKDYSVLGHLDLIKRYDDEGIYPISNVTELIEEILKTAIYDGKGIEINTSSLRYGLPDWTPSWDILKLYQQLGGEILTIGSDAHEVNHLGAYIPRAMQELKERGFRYICTYNKMEPIFHKI